MCAVLLVAGLLFGGCGRKDYAGTYCFCLQGEPVLNGQGEYWGVLTLNSDGTGHILYLDHEDDITYDTETMTLKYLEDGCETTFRYRDGMIFISMIGGEATFVRAEDVSR